MSAVIALVGPTGYFGLIGGLAGVVAPLAGFGSTVSGTGLEDDQDLSDWLIQQWWVPVALCVACCGVGLWMIRSMVLHRGRDSQIRRSAEASGMRYSQQDSYGLSGVRFGHFTGSDGTGWSATNLVTSSGRDGLLAHAFDARCWTELEVVQNGDGEQSYRRRRSGTDPAGVERVVRRYAGATRSAAVTEIPLNAPRLMIVRENVASKLVAALTRLDLDVESEMFNRSYHVLCENRDFARAVLDARVVDLITRTEGRISFELFGHRALLETVLLEPELLPGLARLAEELRSVIPPLAIERWPRAGTSIRTPWTATR